MRALACCSLLHTQLLYLILATRVQIKRYLVTSHPRSPDPPTPGHISLGNLCLQGSPLLLIFCLRGVPWRPARGQ
ncbi:uncharacterized protein F4812DRAFT_447068 [Daldinia caldariorum]|uniref:uncharacterized protein n=1 Tax=Daldinia caldariorum TaxID=326644 RepID=UPI0020072FFE|nr:uncharacterized protein F4812DRAFT_447068 [Daldinia caldariorum]KAI1463455.1 hypothetical protein F4812DRAFT_447068 [Daldinia caldariorum]